MTDTQGKGQSYVMVTRGVKLGTIWKFCAFMFKIYMQAQKHASILVPPPHYIIKAKAV